MTRRRFPLAFALPLALALAAALSAVATTAAAAALPPEGTPEWKQAIFEAMGGTEAALRPTPAIVGGATAPTTRFSHQVALAFYLPQYGGWGQYCGGSLIREDVVLTAAHCDPSVDDGYIMGTNLNHVANFWQWTTYGTLAVKARSVIKHPSFVSNSGVNANDLALVFLNACATPDARTSIIKLANSTEWAANVNATLLMSGWGTTSVNADATTGMNGNPPAGGQLQYGQASYVSSQTCATLAGLGNAAKATMLCAGTVPATGITTPPIQDTCQGDSGGPIIYNAGSPSSPLAGTNANDRLVGVTSWGDGCGRAGKPGVYANVPNLLSWIETTLAANPKVCNGGAPLVSPGPPPPVTPPPPPPPTDSPAPPPDSPSPPPPPPADSQCASASSTQNWFGKSRLVLLAGSPDAAAAAAACCDKCLATSGCRAYSVIPKVSRKGTKRSCALFTAATRLCTASDRAAACKRKCEGSYSANRRRAAAADAP